MLKKLYLFWVYSKQVRKNKKRFSGEEFALRIDYLSRLYTVINIPKEVITEKYGNVSPAVMTASSYSIVRKYVGKVNQEFYRIGLQELAKIKSIREIDENNYYVCFEYALLDMEKVAQNVLSALRNIGIIGGIYILYKILSTI